MSVDVSKFPFKKADVDGLIEHFIESYEARFGTGSAFRAAGIEISAFRIVARARLDRSAATQKGAASSAPSTVSQRRIYSEGAWLQATVYGEGAIRPGFKFEGPAIVEFDDTTLVVGRAQRAEVDKFLNVTITSKA
jgi:N-methylhydantoinase A